MVATALSPLFFLQERLQTVADADDVDWKKLVLIFSTFVYGLETYLTIRQYSMYDKQAPPEALSDKIDSETFAKSQSYGRHKARFSLVSSAYDQALEMLVLYFNVQPWAWTVAGDFLAKRGYGDYEIPHAVLFLGIIMFLGSIPSLPVQLYQTFVLEAEHGFNKTTPWVFFTDILKGWLLAAVLGAPFIGAFLYIIRWAGDSFIPYLMGFMIAFQLIMVIIYPILIQPLFNKLSPLPEGVLRARVEKLASSLKFPLTDLYVIDGGKRSAHSNAYFYGLPWSKHIVIFDTLIEQSSPEEIEAVLAHELGHWSYSHPMKMMLVGQIHMFLVFSAFPPFLRSRQLVKSFGFPSSVYSPKSGANPPTFVTFMLFQMILSPFEALVKLGMNALSRHYEWQADQFALKLGNSPSDVDVKVEEDETNGNGAVEKAHAHDGDDMGARLARALISLHVKNLSTVWVDWLYSAYHYSHPTLTERLQAMEDYRKTSGAKTSAQLKKEL